MTFRLLILLVNMYTIQYTELKITKHQNEPKFNLHEINVAKHIYQPLMSRAFPILKIENNAESIILFTSQKGN